jgi:hypothetical protein
MTHSYKTCHASGFVSPRANKTPKQFTCQHESVYINLALRDKVDFEKIRNVKLVHAFVHKRIFLFYSKTQIYEEL